MVMRNQGGENVPQRDRAQYFRDRRKKFKYFSVEVDMQKMERFEEHLKQKNISKTDWLNEKIDEELGE